MASKYQTPNSVYLLSKMSDAEVKRLRLVAHRFIASDFERLSQHFASSKKIADIGCGTGEITHAIARQYPTSQVFGFDADPFSLEQSSQLINGADNLHFNHWILGSDQNPTGSPFDMILIRFVLMHIPEPDKALKTLNKYLTKNGLIYIVDIVDIDDRDTFFMPIEPWQDKLLDVFQIVQTKRRGDRQLGRKLGNILENIGFKTIHLEKVFSSKKDTGHEKFQRMILPLVKFYLDLAVEDGIDTENLFDDFRSFCENPTTEIKLCCWHASATINNI